jgi:hypothetical protein
MQARIVADILPLPQTQQLKMKLKQCISRSRLLHQMDRSLLIHDGLQSRGCMLLQHTTQYKLQYVVRTVCNPQPPQFTVTATNATHRLQISLKIP